MKTVALDTLFKVQPGNSLELNRLETTNSFDKDRINFVSRSRENNGVSAYVRELNEIEPFEQGLITVAGSGNSILEAFIQPHSFYTGFHMFVLLPKVELSVQQKLFYCYCIKKNKFKYSYGRQANRTLQSLQVPALSEIPKSFLTFTVTPPLKESRLNLSRPLRTEKWKMFKYGGKSGVFRIKNGYYNRKPEATDQGSIPFIGASEFNNGVTGYYSQFDIENTDKDERSGNHPLSSKIFTGNCVTVSNNGSVGYAFYQQVDFTCSHDINILYLKNREWTKPLALFVCTLIELEQYRWAYGRKWRPSRMPNSDIKLPVKHNGEPDWKFMEDYILSLPYSANL